MLILFLRFPLPGYCMPMGINLSSVLPLFLPDQRRVNLLVIPKSNLAHHHKIWISICHKFFSVCGT